MGNLKRIASELRKGQQQDGGYTDLEILGFILETVERLVKLSDRYQGLATTPAIFIRLKAIDQELLSILKKVDGPSEKNPYEP